MPISPYHFYRAPVGRSAPYNLWLSGEQQRARAAATMLDSSIAALRSRNDRAHDRDMLDRRALVQENLVKLEKNLIARRQSEMSLQRQRAAAKVESDRVELWSDLQARAYDEKGGILNRQKAPAYRTLGVPNADDAMRLVVANRNLQPEEEQSLRKQLEQPYEATWRNDEQLGAWAREKMTGGKYHPEAVRRAIEQFQESYKATSFEDAVEPKRGELTSFLRTNLPARSTTAEETGGTVRIPGVGEQRISGLGDEQMDAVIDLLARERLKGSAVEFMPPAERQAALDKAKANYRTLLQGGEPEGEEVVTGDEDQVGPPPAETAPAPTPAAEAPPVEPQEPTTQTATDWGQLGGEQQAKVSRELVQVMRSAGDVEDLQRALGGIDPDTLPPELVFALEEAAAREPGMSDADRWKRNSRNWQMLEGELNKGNSTGTPGLP